MIEVTGGCDRGHLGRAWLRARGTAEAAVTTWVEALNGLFSFVEGGREVEEIEFRNIPDFADQRGQRQFEFGEGSFLFSAGGGRDQGAQLSHALFQGGGHNPLRMAEIGELNSTV